jgi:putative membrane protein
MAALLAQAPRWCPWCGDHMAWGGGLMMVFLLLVVLVIVVAVVLLLRRNGLGGGTSAADRADAHLRERYARGDIDEETYRRMRDELRR